MKNKSNQEIFEELKPRWIRAFHNVNKKAVIKCVYKDGYVQYSTELFPFSKDKVRLSKFKEMTETLESRV